MTASHCTSGHKSVKSRIKNASRDLAQFNSCCVQSFALNNFQLLWSTRMCCTCTLYSIFLEFSHNDIKNVCLFCWLIILSSKYKMFSLIFQKGKMYTLLALKLMDDNWIRNKVRKLKVDLLIFCHQMQIVNAPLTFGNLSRSGNIFSCPLDIVMNLIS